MLRHAAVLAISTAVALAAGQAVLTLSAAEASARASGPAPAEGLRQAATIAKSADGHYWARATVDGRPVTMLVDTGASTVALTAADALRLGYDPAGLTFDTPLVTARGATRAAAVTLADVSVGHVRVEHVRALVVRRGLPSSLLGMSYLGRLARFEATPGSLVMSR